MKKSDPQPGYFRPTNRVAAIWASCVEQFLINENPGLSISEIRKTAMMRGVYSQLQMLADGVNVSAPSINSTAVERAAYNSQLFFAMGSTIARGAPSYKSTGLIDDFRDALNSGVNWGEGVAYDLYIEYVVETFIGDDRLYSTDDVAGFALCTLVYLAIILSIEMSNPTDFVRNAIADFVIKYVLKYFKKIFNIGDGAATDFLLISGKLEVFEFAMSYYRSPSANYKVVPWKMPDNAQIIMLGDWGTGLPDAHDFLYELWKKAFTDADGKNRQIVFIHLGDIYYCGLNVECERFFSDVFTSVGERLERELGAKGFKANAPIFTVPGNHEYYSMGRGYFRMIDAINKKTQEKYFPGEDISQPFSFFCLRTKNGKWQFLGMDTGQDDGDGLMSALQAVLERLWKPMPLQPVLNEAETKWHKDRLNEFNSGKTILLSHHQLFSRQAKLNFKDPVFFNTSLNDVFKPYFNKVAAWFWGHEHTFALYKDGIFGLNKARLLGSSSYEASLESDSPYKNNYPIVPFSSAMTDGSIKLGETVTNGQHFFNHAAAILRLNNDEIDVDYLQYPTWGQNDQKPANSALTSLYKEKIKNSNFVSYDPVWHGNKKIEVEIGHQKGLPVYQPPHAASGHATAVLDNTVYLLYADGRDGNKIKMTTTDAEKFKKQNNLNNLYLTEARTMVLERAGGHVVSGVAPAMFTFNGQIYASVVTNDKKLYMLRYKPETGLWYEEFFLSGTAEFTPVLCLHHCRLYMIYKTTATPDKEFIMAIWDVGHASSPWFYQPVTLADKNGKPIKMNAVCAVASTSVYHQYNPDMPDEIKNRKTFMQMVFRSTDGDGKKLYTSRFVDDKWSVPVQFRMNNYDLVADLSPTLVHHNAQLYLVYVTGSGGRLKMCFLDPADGFLDYDPDSKWFGDIEIKVNGKAVTTKTTPSLCFAGGVAFVLYVDNDAKNNDIYFCNF